MFDEYPYTDLHNLNLDWFLDQFKKMGKHLADLKKIVLSAPDATDATAGQAPIADGAGGWQWGDVASGSGGQPTPVTSASDMVDTEKLYLYLGNESGYQYGYIYAYINGAWTSTGLYGRGQAGASGADGYSPTATVTQTATGVSISVTDKDGTTTATVENGTATDEQVDAWLDEHPEATTTVQDGSITSAKLATSAFDNTFSIRGKIADAKATGNAVRALDDTQDWLGYPKNLFDEDFYTPTPNNWEVSQTGNSVTFLHKTQYITGFPRSNPLNIPAGTYHFSADFNGVEHALSLYNAGNTPPTYIRTLSESDTLVLEEGISYCLFCGTTPEAGESVTISDITITETEFNGKIQQIENDISALQSNESVTAQTVEDLQSGFNSIAQPDISELVGEETINKAINASGALITGGTDAYRVCKYSVTVGKKYWVTATTNFSNLLWCFYASDDSVLQTGTAAASGSSFTTVTDTEVTAPVNSAYIIIAYRSDIKQGALKTQTGYKTAKWLGKKWVCVGDSLTAENIRTTKHYFDYVVETTGITIVNMGVSGSGYARLADSNQAFYQRISSCPTDADVVTIFGSFNDLGAGLPIGTINDTGTDTLAGCINTTINNLQAVIPLVNLGIVAPTPWDTTQPSTSGQAYNYVQMLKAICERRSIPFLDLWRCSNLRPWDADFRELAYSKDGGSGTHPDENGHKLIAPRFKGFLETLLM